MSSEKRGEGIWGSSGQQGAGAGAGETGRGPGCASSGGGRRTVLRRRTTWKAILTSQVSPPRGDSGRDGEKVASSSHFIPRVLRNPGTSGLEGQHRPPRVAPADSPPLGSGWGRVLGKVGGLGVVQASSDWGVAADSGRLIRGSLRPSESVMTLLGPSLRPPAPTLILLRTSLPLPTCQHSFPTPKKQRDPGLVVGAAPGRQDPQKVCVGVD